MNLRLLLGLVAVLAALVPASAANASLPPGDPTVGIDRLSAGRSSLAVVRGIATFDAVPSALDVAALQSHGLVVQPMKHLPLALVRGTVQSMESAVALGTANDVYPDDPIELFDQASADAMGAAIPRANGFTGKATTVAVVDSGCDASHPDLADRVTHNVKLYSAEYVNVPPDSSNTIAVPIEMGPYQNSDIGSGHGTHVAGIIAADGHTAGNHIGVAPDANLVCYSIGEVLFTTAVVTAYDHLLDQPQLWGVKVINNSWGNSFQQFDARAPVNVATRAVADLGVNVFFAAGNSGRSNAEMSLNPFSQAPWVTSVAAENVSHQRADFSSNGLQYDNSLPSTIGAGGHTVFTGDRVGIYHPDITTPGEAISSTCDTAGSPVVIGPCPPPNYSNATASGTSMASPHAAGAAAVLLQANPNLSTTQIRSVLQATAKPVTDRVSGAELGFWQIGYGRVDLAPAVDLVRGTNVSKRITSAQAAADKRVLATTPWTVSHSDFWTWDAPRVAVAGSDTRTVHTEVSSRTTHLKVTLSHPSLAVVGSNGMIWTVTVIDGAGQQLGKTTESTSGAGTASLLVDLSAAAAHPGEYQFIVKGERAVSDPDTFDSESLLGRVVVLQVAQARAS
jgi:serine protease AprX